MVVETVARALVLSLGGSHKQLLDAAEQHTQHSEDVSKSKGPAAHAHAVDHEVDQEPINDHIGQEDTEAAPLVAIVHIEGVHVLGAVGVRAVLAIRRGVGVGEIADASTRNPVAGVLRAGLAGGRVEVSGFRGRTFDVNCGEDARDDTTEPPGDRVDVVHPVLPEHRVRGVRTDNTVEQAGHDEEEGKGLVNMSAGFASVDLTRRITHVGNDGEGRSKGTDPLTPAGLEQEEKHGHEEDISGITRIRRETSRVVPQQPVDQSGDDSHRNFTDDVRRAECDPAVNTTGVLTCFPKCPIDIKLGNQTVQDDRRKKDDQEDREHAVLHARNGVSKHPEGLHEN